jgi:glutamyl-tRNA reductase
MSSTAWRIPLALVGCDFRVAPSSLRSRLVLGADRVAALAAGLASPGAADGLVVLETCNRDEWIVSAADPEWAAELLLAQMRQALGEAASWVRPYRLTGEEAARHVARVVLGMESLVVGERQIAGQLFHAFQDAREQGRSSRVLNGLGTAAGRLLRLAEREGHAARTGRGVHSLAIDYLRHHFGTVDTRVVVVGTGAIGRRVLGVASSDCRMTTVACNRTTMATRNGTTRPLDELPALLAGAGAVIVCTGAPRPVVTAAMLGAAPRQNPLLIIDIGIPEQVERVGLGANVTVVGLDELAAFHRSRQDAGGDLDESRLEALVDETIGDLAWFCSVPDYAGIIETLVHRSKPVLSERIARIVAALPPEVSQQQRSELERDLKEIVQDYTNDVLASVKESGRGRQGERA